MRSISFFPSIKQIRIIRSNLRSKLITDAYKNVLKIKLNPFEPGIYTDGISYNGSSWATDQIIFNKEWG